MNDPRSEDRLRDERLTTADLASGAERAERQDLESRDREAREREADLRMKAGGLPIPEPRRDLTGDERTALFNDEDLRTLRARWESIQAGFVDDPRRAAQDADHLVASTIQRLAESFAGERADLEKQWATGDDVSTEELRIALRRYHSFFDRLLSV